LTKCLISVTINAVKPTSPNNKRSLSDSDNLGDEDEDANCNVFRRNWPRLEHLNIVDDDPNFVVVVVVVVVIVVVVIGENALIDDKANKNNQ
jgi:hypothetical protein